MVIKKLITIFSIFLILTGAVHSALPKSIQIDQKQALIIKALENRNNINCPVVINNSNELEKLTTKFPVLLYYYRARCLAKTRYYQKAFQDLEQYFSRNRKKNKVYQKALILHAHIEKQQKQVQIAEVERRKQAKLDKRIAAEAVLLAEKNKLEEKKLAEKQKAEAIVKLNKDNLDYLDRYLYKLATLKEKYMSSRRNNCATYKSAKKMLSEYGQRCYERECRDNKKYYERKLDKQDRKIEKIKRRLDKLRSKFDSHQNSIAREGGKKFSRYGLTNPYLDSDGKKLSCSRSMIGASLSW